MLRCFKNLALVTSRFHTRKAAFPMFFRSHFCCCSKLTWRSSQKRENRSIQHVNYHNSSYHLLIIIILNIINSNNNDVSYIYIINSIIFHFLILPTNSSWLRSQSASPTEVLQFAFPSSCKAGHRPSWI